MFNFEKASRRLKRSVIIILICHFSKSWFVNKVANPFEPVRLTRRMNKNTLYVFCLFILCNKQNLSIVHWNYFPQVMIKKRASLFIFDPSSILGVKVLEKWINCEFSKLVKF